MDALGMGQLVDRALRQLRQTVGEADLGVEQHAVAFQLVQRGYQGNGCAGSQHQGLPLRHAHGRTVDPAPAHKPGACRGGLAAQLHRQQVQRGNTGAVEQGGQCLLDQLITHRQAGFGQRQQLPLTFEKAF